MVPLAGIFPAELTALRAVGLAVALILVVYAVARRRQLRNADVLLLILAGLALAVVTGTEVVNGLLSAFSFEKGNGGRILGLAVFAIFILFIIILRALSVGARNSRQLSAALEGLAWEEFRQAGLPARFKDRIAILIPAYNEAENIGVVLDQMPAEVCGVRTEILVVDDGSRDGTGDVAAEHGAAVARHVTNRGGGAALRTGYRLMVESGALIVVTIDADGQHLPSEMPRLVEPVLSGEVDMAHGSRVLGHADRNTRARELGIVFFNRLVSFITRTHVTDCSNGYRAVRTTVLPQLVLRQEQFHTSEFMIEAIKRGIPAKEVPITVEQRLHGHSKKPAVMRYGLGFANAIVRTWLRYGSRGRRGGGPRAGPAGRARSRSGGRPGRRASAPCGSWGTGVRVRRARGARGSRRSGRRSAARTDQEPDPEGAALGLADDPGGEAEDEDDEEVLEAHRPQLWRVGPDRTSRPAPRAGQESAPEGRKQCQEPRRLPSSMAIPKVTPTQAELDSTKPGGKHRAGQARRRSTPIRHGKKHKQTPRQAQRNIQEEARKIPSPRRSPAAPVPPRRPPRPRPGNRVPAAPSVAASASPRRTACSPARASARPRARRTRSSRSAWSARSSP